MEPHLLLAAHPLPMLAAEAVAEVGILVLETARAAQAVAATAAAIPRIMLAVRVVQTQAAVEAVQLAAAAVGQQRAAQAVPAS
jgi:hypothetical protein